MITELLKKRINAAMGKSPADFVIKNCKIVNVYTNEIIDGDIAICDGIIAGIGSYNGEKEFDANGAFAGPGFIDSHIHIESSFTTPEEFGKMIVPLGTTTIIADPHEITNVCGIEGFKYMLKAAKQIALDIKFVVPSCVPCSPFENSGAILNSSEIESLINEDNVIGLGEFMNYVGVINNDEECLKKICTAHNNNKIIDGHAPGLLGVGRQSYISSGVSTDHECSTVEEMKQSLRNGMYVELRNGSACHDLENLISVVTENNARRCLLCSDDMQPITIFNKGHINNDIRMCVAAGINPFTAIKMGSLNAAECYNLKDRGAIVPGKRADIVLFDNLKDFNVQNVFIAGEHVAQNGQYLKKVIKADISKVSSSVHIDKFKTEQLKLHLNSQNVYAIEIIPKSIVTKKITTKVKTDDDGNFIFDKDIDVAKIAVIERHHNTGNIGLGLIKNYGIKFGAVAITIAHDSHNIIVVGTNDEDMSIAVKTIANLRGGIVLVKDGEIIDSMALPIAGLMSDKDGLQVMEELKRINTNAYEQLGINKKIEPISTLSFMSLPVIPEIKITDKGLFDVTKFEFMNIEV